MPNQSNEPPTSPHLQPYDQTLSLSNLSGELGPVPTDLAEKSRQPGLRKARKLSRVFSEFSFLGPFTLRKSVEDLRASRWKPKTTLIRPATSHGHTHKPELGGNFDTKQSRPMSSASTLASIVPQANAILIPISEPKTLLECAPQTSVVLGTLSTPQIKPLIPPSPESIPLPPSRPSSLRRSTIIRKQKEDLVFNQSDDDDSAAECQAPSPSCRKTPVPSLPLPITTPNFPSPSSGLPHDTGDSSLEVARQHFAEVKRARKMTRLFGQKLPPDLIRVVDDGWKAGRFRGRTDSTVSSTPDSVPSTPTCESCTNVPEGENVMPTSPPTSSRVDFQERRRRAAKLSQFFGVNHAEIASSIVFTKPDHHRAISSDCLQKPVSLASGEPSEVGVKVVSRRRWGLGEDMRDVELSDAINKLRCLKAN